MATLELGLALLVYAPTSSFRFCDKSIGLGSSARHVFGFGLSASTADGREEGLEVGVKILLGDVELPVEKIEQLLFHQVDLRQGEAESRVVFEEAVAGPILVLGRAVVDVFGGEDEASEEDAVKGAGHAFGHGRQPTAEPVQVHERAHQRRHLHLRLLHDGGNEDFDGREGGGGGGCCWRMCCCCCCCSWS